MKGHELRERAHEFPEWSKATLCRECSLCILRGIMNDEDLCNRTGIPKRLGDKTIGCYQGEKLE